MHVLEKCPSGISGLDTIAGGGLPRGRPTLVCGGPGCGKSLLALEFVVRGARDLGEPGVFVSFEESIAELDRNVATLGFDLPALREAGLLAMDHVLLSGSNVEETGEYDLDGLFVRLAHAIDSVGARRVALDTIETLFANLKDEQTLRSELVRLFRWLKDRGVTAVITGEQGQGALTRYGLEEYVSDCVLFLDHRVTAHVSTRHLRFVKYRGSAHSTNEYPFSIGATGIRVLPVSAIKLDYPALEERVSTGIEPLDEMLGGGPHRGSSVLLSGTAGTGKTTLASFLVDAVCRAGEPALMFSFEESPAQIERNMASVGLDLARWRERGLLRIEALRPQFLGLEQHILNMQQHVEEHRPSAKTRSGEARPDRSIASSTPRARHADRCTSNPFRRRA
jgi:circadian clock protein KaiC